jgi:hypothetical protein
MEPFVRSRAITHHGFENHRILFRNDQKAEEKQGQEIAIYGSSHKPHILDANDQRSQKAATIYFSTAVFRHIDAPLAIFLFALHSGDSNDFQETFDKLVQNP